MAHAINIAALGVILHFTDLDGTHWEREMNMAPWAETEFDGSGRYRWFRRQMSAGEKKFWDGVPEGNPPREPEK